MIAVARTTVPAAWRGRTTVVVAVVVIAIAVITATVVVIDGADADGRIARAVVAVSIVVVTAAWRYDRGSRLRAVIRVAPRAIADIAVARVVITTGQREASRECQKQGMRTTHGRSLMRMTVFDDLDTAPMRLNGR
jgi:hypothetical protein